MHRLGAGYAARCLGGKHGANQSLVHEHASRVAWQLPRRGAAKLRRERPWNVPDFRFWRAAHPHPLHAEAGEPAGRPLAAAGRLEVQSSRGCGSPLLPSASGIPSPLPSLPSGLPSPSSLHPFCSPRRMKALPPRFRGRARSREFFVVPGCFKHSGTQFQRSVALISRAQLSSARRSETASAL